MGEESKRFLAAHVHTLILLVALLTLAADIYVERRNRNEREVLQIQHHQDQNELMRQAVNANTAELAKLDQTLREIMRNRPKE